MIEMAFYLILTFYADSSMTSQMIPRPYVSVEACKQAGDMAAHTYNGGAKVNYTCVGEP